MSAESFSTLGNTLFERLKELRDRKGESITVSDAEQILGGVIAGLTDGMGSADKHLRAELNDMLSVLTAARNEMSSSSSVSVDKITNSHGDLNEVIKSTEDAANAIMDAADEIQNAAMNLEGEARELITGAVTRIFEACNFQDLTGQRVRKAMTTLEYIEGKMHELARVYGIKHTTGDDREGDARLLNGPQVNSETPNQNDIDALFNSLPTDKPAA